MRKKYDTPATPCDQLLACAKVSEETKIQLRATSRSLDPMDLAADIEERLGRIFTIVDYIEEDRLDEMARAGEPDPEAGSLVRTAFRTSGKPCQIHPKKPKPNQAPGVMNPDTTTQPIRCHLSLAQYARPFISLATGMGQASESRPLFRVGARTTSPPPFGRNQSTFAISNGQHLIPYCQGFTVSHSRRHRTGKSHDRQRRGGLRTCRR